MGETMKMPPRSLALIGLLGGVGGMVNAWHCYSIKILDFSWSIIPAGFCHGMVLAVVSVLGAVLFLKRAWGVRLVGLPVVGWLAGWWSGIPLWLHYFWTTPPIFKGEVAGMTWSKIVRAFIWPFGGGIWQPYFWFGLVGAAYYALLNLSQQLTSKRLMTHLMMGIISGILGSLWWWISSKMGYLSVVHGTIWGSLVGFGVWKSQQARKPVD
ncbi:MAG: hypothetical protein HY595_04365 [Candidatus Omnitrophica bacterium]|nr:hypothetical protein [Candidatus Omnitrophota bacterium]